MDYRNKELFYRNVTFESRRLEWKCDGFVPVISGKPEKEKADV